jgi:hypothetical protein
MGMFDFSGSSKGMELMMKSVLNGMGINQEFVETVAKNFLAMVKEIRDNSASAAIDAEETRRIALENNALLKGLTNAPGKNEPVQLIEHVPVRSRSGRRSGEA